MLLKHGSIATSLKRSCSTLLSNAFKHAPEEGKIAIRIAEGKET
jgi:signal transduction histidine kinase